MKKACVIGWPISHSRSPLIHGFWLKQLGISGSYERIPVKPEDLAKFIHDLPTNNYSGCNVTLPHKEKVYHLVAPADESTRRLGAVNTVYVRGTKLLGTNTDGEGFINSLASTQKNYDLKNKRAVILGAGGAAMAIADAMIFNGVTEITIVNRTLEKAMDLRHRFGPIITAAPWSMRSDILTDCDILINTTSLGMKGQDDLEIGLSRLNASAVVTDIVYVPLRTKLLEQAAARGNPVVEGLGMLLHQAVRGFELWFGVKPEVTAELHDLIALDIDPGLQAMIVAGLTGSIAMGKSETAKQFASRGIPVFDSDAVVHQLYAEGGAAVKAISTLAPEAILDGTVNRGRLSLAIRQRPELLGAIENAVHPLVRVMQEDFLEKARTAGCPLAVLDIPLLFETGRNLEVDKIIVVTTRPEIQRERALRRPGMTVEKLDFLVSKQMPDAEKRSRADYVIDTSVSIADSQKQVDHILSELVRSAGP